MANCAHFCWQSCTVTLLAAGSLEASGTGMGMDGVTGAPPAAAAMGVAAAPCVYISMYAYLCLQLCLCVEVRNRVSFNVCTLCLLVRLKRVSMYALCV